MAGSEECDSSQPVCLQQPSKHQQISQNVFTYLQNRQLGISRNSIDLSQWIWMFS
ncbi:embryonic testis differentiation protein homolog B [Ochotona princeps]|uniref:embryonic testis differentiation protein homolog B n=1 Tax=Ochotona princeps TaxID=9978 RepID=UPI002714867B|nr:embryonic testis differentiation protein homolog B [Ochotona princeps]